MKQLFNQAKEYKKLIKKITVGKCSSCNGRIKEKYYQHNNKKACSNECMLNILGVVKIEV